MEFNIRMLREEDYDNILVNWWKDWGGEIPSKEFLPDNGLGGLMVSKGDINICAGYLYKSNSAIAYCEFIISNYNYREKDRKDAIVFLIDNIGSLAKYLGYKTIWATVSNKSLAFRYENAGYIKTQTNCVELIKHL